MTYMACMQMQGDMRLMQGELGELKQSQLHANEGIFTLVSAIRDIVAGGQKSKYSSMATLDNYISRSKNMPLPQHAVCLVIC